MGADGPNDHVTGDRRFGATFEDAIEGGFHSVAAFGRKSTCAKVAIQRLRTEIIDLADFVWAAPVHVFGFDYFAFAVHADLALADMTGRPPGRHTRRCRMHCKPMA